MDETAQLVAKRAVSTFEVTASYLMRRPYYLRMQQGTAGVAADLSD
jgi:hypothetical protein